MNRHADVRLARTRWRALLQDAGDRALDRYLGIETARPVYHGELGFADGTGFHYQPSNWVNLLLLHQVLRGCRVTDADTFIDFGCGKGQVLALAASFPFRRVIGLDLSPGLIAIARRNMDRIATRSHCGAIELVEQNALDYTIPDDLTIAYFYMPFPTSVYERVVSAIADSLARHPRPFRIVYLEQGPDDPAVPGRYGFRQLFQRRRMAVYAHGAADGSEPDAPGSTH